MSEKLNVCLLNDSFPPVIDGVANAVLNYAQIIQQNQWGNTMVATPSVPDAEDDYPFPVFRYPSINTTKLIGYRAGYPFDPSVVNGLEKQNIDVIHSHCPVMSTLLARTMRKSIDKPIILTYHTKFDIDIAKAVKSDFIQSAALKFLATNISACDEVWAVSHGAGENLRKIGYEGDYVVMENGVDFPKGRVTAEEIENITKLHSLQKDMPVFLFVGRMMWYKGVKISLDGLRIAKEKGENFKMIFIGDGADKDDIEKYAKEIGLENECLFVGAVHDRELLRAYFCRCDLFLFPSTYDTNGIVVREAAACGLGSILIKESCAAEGITDGRSGILIEENAQSMSEAIVQGCHNLDKLHDIGQHAMNEIYMSWEDSVKHAVDRYHIVIENSHSKELSVVKERNNDLFKFMSDICSGIEKVQDTHAKFRTKEQDLFDKVKPSQVITMVKIKEQVFRDKITDIKDRYL